jgi:hypothetical protein
MLFWHQREPSPSQRGSYPILEKYGPLPYRVALPPRLLGVQNLFHVSQFKRCLKPLTNVLMEDTITLELDLTYKCYLVKLLEQQDRTTRRKTVRFYKVQWNGHSEDEATWECEDFLRSTILSFFHQVKNPNHTPHFSFT